jgi:hypothetical protein
MLVRWAFSPCSRWVLGCSPWRLQPADGNPARATNGGGRAGIWRARFACLRCARHVLTDALKHRIGKLSMPACQGRTGPGMQPGRLEAHNGRVSRASHGDWLTHRRWPWPPRRQACNRPGTSGGYLAERPHPAQGRPSPPGPAIWGAAAPDLLRPFLPVVSEMTGPPPAVPTRPDLEPAGSWLADIAEPAARELAAAPMRSSWPHPPATRAGAARHHAP